jgi:DNA uptake protein ComE-like DNA-binding protein
MKLKPVLLLTVASIVGVVMCSCGGDAAPEPSGEDVSNMVDYTKTYASFVEESIKKDSGELGTGMPNDDSGLENPTMAGMPVVSVVSSDSQSVKKQDTSKGEKKQKSVKVVKPKPALGSVSLNTASVEELDQVPGLGKSSVKSIIAARPFKSIEDLNKVKGLKKKVLGKAKPYFKL